jgi:glycosyltransferase involved in cell wall biosynthesis
MGYPCGAADFVDNLSNKLAALNKVTVINANPNSVQKTNVDIKVINGPWSIWKVISMAKWIRDNNFDVVDVQYESYMYGYGGSILLIPLFLPKKIKKVLTLHSEGLPKWGSKLWRLAQYSLFEEVIFYSEHFLNNALKRFSKMKDKFNLVPFPSNITRIEETPLKKILKQSFKGFDPSVLQVSYFGHLSQNRGIEEMVQALADLSSDKIHLIFIGQFIPDKNIYHRDLLALIKKLNVEQKITFTERLDEKEVSSIIQITDLALLPFVEGASFKNGSLAAYISHQIPVATTKSDLTEKLLLDNKGILFFDSKNLSSMKEVLNSVQKDPSILENMQGEISKLSDYYSWNNYIENRLTCYQK